MPRQPREIVRIAGLGGYIMPSDYDPLSAGDQPGKFLEISMWEVRNISRLVEDTHSGSGGAITRSLVGNDWTCRFNIPWNARLAQEAASRGSVGFLEEILIGAVSASYYVSILFALGDSLSYNQAGAGGEDERAFYWAQKMLLGEVVTINDNTGHNIIRMQCAGLGSSLLTGWRGNVQKFGKANEPGEPPEPDPR